MLDRDSVIHLVSSFTSEDVVYVTGHLKYVNSFRESLQVKLKIDIGTMIFLLEVKNQILKLLQLVMERFML